MSATATTHSIVRYLNLNGFVTWSVYNGAVFDRVKDLYRKNPLKKKGVFDICGFRISDGKHLEVEVKHNKDVMSIHQIRHFQDLKRSGAINFVVKSFDDFLKQFQHEILN